MSYTIFYKILNFYISAKAMKRRVGGASRGREPGGWEQARLNAAEHGLGAVRRPLGGFLRPAQGRDGRARYSARVCLYPQRPAPRGGGETGWYHGAYSAVPDEMQTLIRDGFFAVPAVKNRLSDFQNFKFAKILQTFCRQEEPVLCLSVFPTNCPP